MANEGMQKQWNSPEFLKMWRGLEPTVSALTAPLMAALKPLPGERLLDVGCGGGLPTIEAAAAVAPAGHATGADISADLLELARSRATEAGVANVSFVTADVQIDDIPGAPFDAVFSRLGVMFFADPIEAFTNIRGQMRAGARLVFVCFQGFDANSWYPARVLSKYAPPRPPSRFASPSPFALGIEAATRSYLEEAGFEGIRFESLSALTETPYNENTNRGTLAPFGLSEDQAAAALAELREHDRPYVSDGVLRTERKFWIVRATNR